eukprot:3009298-Pyramimonas_sp.AAC.1
MKWSLSGKSMATCGLAVPGAKPPGRAAITRGSLKTARPHSRRASEVLTHSLDSGAHQRPEQAACAQDRRPPQPAPPRGRLGRWAGRQGSPCPPPRLRGG